MFELDSFTKVKVLRPLPGYEGLYAVSEDGSIRSLPRVVERSNGALMTVQGRWMKPVLRSDGYQKVTLHRDNRPGRSMLVHRAVAATWLPSPEGDGLEINHKDAVKTNNRASNLEWCTSSENSRHAVALGLINFHSPARKAASMRLGKSKRKLDDSQVAAIREILQSDVSRRKLARQFGVDWLTIARIERGETYRSECNV